MLPFTLLVGDDFWHDNALGEIWEPSERWSMHVGDYSCTDPDYGVFAQRDCYFQAGKSYEISLEHLGTDPAFLATPPGLGWYPEGAVGPNYDWKASVTPTYPETLNYCYWIDDPVSIAPGVGWFDDHEYQLLGQWGHSWMVIGQPNLAYGKTATLHVGLLDADIGSELGDEDADRAEADPANAEFIRLSEPGSRHLVPMTLHLSQNVDAADLLENGLTYTFHYPSSLLISLDGEEVIPSETAIPASELNLQPGGTVTVYIEGIQNTYNPVQIEVCANIAATNGGGTLRDKVHVVVGSVDIDTDSDNVGGLQCSAAEDLIEDDASKPGKFIQLNVDDDNDNDIIDRDDDHSDYPLPSEDDLAAISIGYSLDPSRFAGYELWLGAQSGLELCGGTTKSPLNTPLVDGMWYKWVIGDTPAPPSYVYAEGLATGTHHVYWRLVKQNGSPNTDADVLARDTIQISVVNVDLDVDSDNNSVNSLDWSDEEEVVENDSDHPGKIIASRLGRDADGDGVPDYEDNFVDSSAVDALFAAIAVEASPYDSFFQNATYKFSYEASDPGAATLPAPGNLRIWTKEANETRNPDDVLNGGDYLAPHSVYTAAQVKMDEYGQSELYLEGINPGESTVTFYVDPDGPSGPMGWILSDTVKVTVVHVDIDTDSDNVGEFEASLAEDLIEDDASKPGKLIPLNVDDDNLNNIIDSLDDHDDYPAEKPVDNDFAMISIQHFGIDASILAGYKLCLGRQSGLELYEDMRKTPLDTPYFTAGMWYESIIGTHPSPPDIVFAEGLGTGTHHVYWRLVKPGGSPDVDADVLARDTIQISVVNVDADVDSDNNSGNSLDYSDDEEVVENDSDHPGKVILSRLGLDSDGDGIPNYEDGHNYDGTLGNDDDSESSAVDAMFAALALKASPVEFFPRATATYKLSYSASDPKFATGPSTGHLRIWTKEAHESRNNNDLVSGGDYVAPGTAYTAEQLGLDSLYGDASLCMEGINPGSSTIDFYVDPDGPSGPIDWIFLDTVKVTVVNIDLDVDNDGVLSSYGTVDGTLNYLPGYEGTTNMLVSTAAAYDYNSVSFQPQAMKIIADGAGTDVGITSVSYSISTSAVTSYDGYAENKSDASIGGSNDYSFSSTQDDTSHTGTASSTKNTVDFYCKDFGGYAEVLVTLNMGSASVLTHTLKVPFDSDGDKIADKWEREQVRNWNSQFATTETVGTAFFATTDDPELVDPDGTTNTDGGTNLPAHKAAGDGLTVFQEYRGYILDNGAGRDKGHQRLSVAHKEFLVEVDMMVTEDLTATPPIPGVTNMPNIAGVKTWMNEIAAAMEDAVTGCGLHMYYVIDETDTPYDTFVATPTHTTRDLVFDYADNHANPLLSDFRHLHLVDEYDGMAHSGWADGTTATYAVDSGHAFKALYNTDESSYIAHELHHIQMNENGRHFTDTDGDGIHGEADDKVLVLWDYTYQYPSKKLGAAINSTATSIPLNNTTDLTTRGRIQIGSELIEYTGISGSTLTGCTRGLGTSVAASHVVSATVQPICSAEDYKGIRFGAGTISKIDIS